MFYNRQILASNNKTKNCEILLKLKLTGKVRQKLFFVSAVIMSRYFRFLQQFFPFNSW